VEVAVDTLPEGKLHGTVRAVSGVATRQVFDTGTRQFDVTFDVDGTARVRPGLTASIAILGPTLEDVLFLPRTPISATNGQPTVYVRQGAGFEPRDVRVRTWTDSYAVVENVPVETEVALVDPNAAGRSRPRAQAAPASQRASR